MHVNLTYAIKGTGLAQATGVIVNVDALLVKANIGHFTGERTGHVAAIGTRPIPCSLVAK